MQKLPLPERLMAAGGIDDDFLDDLDDLGGDEETAVQDSQSVPASSGAPNEAASTSAGGEGSGAAAMEQEGGDSESDEDDIWFSGSKPAKAAEAQERVVPPSLPSASSLSAIDRQAEAESETLRSVDAMRSGTDTAAGSAKAVDEMPPRLRSIARLRASASFADHMARVREATLRPAPKAIVGALEAQPEYKLLVASNVLVQQVEEEQEAVHKLVADTYQAHFPQLIDLVSDPLMYCKAAYMIRNSKDLTKLDLESVLPRNVAMGVVVAGSSTAGRDLSEEELSLCVAGCEEAERLDQDRTAMLDFVESRMSVLAPNLSTLLGTAAAARLVGLAGGLARLSEVPGCNILVMGKPKQRMLGMSTVGRDPHVGVIAQSPLVSEAPKHLRRRAAKVAASRAALAARVDCHRTHQDGRTGESFRDQILAQIDKWDEPPPSKSVKPLPLPDQVKRKKRGGQLARKRKAKFGLTDVRQLAGRTTFGTTEGEYGDVAMGSTLGMLSQRKTAAGSSSRIVSKAQEQKKMFVGYKRGKPKGGKAARSAASSQSSSQAAGRVGPPGAGASVRGGLDTSLVLTPMVGAGGKAISAADRVRKANERYFAQAGTFTQVRKD